MLSFSFFSCGKDDYEGAEYKISTASELLSLDLKAGDVVIMANGTWNGQNVSLRGEGTEDAPITLRAETQGDVILAGSSSLKMTGKYLVVDGLSFIGDGEVQDMDEDVITFSGSNIRLTNTIIKNYNPSSESTEYKWVSIYGKNHRVDHCQFEGKNHEGALMVIWIKSGGDNNYHQIDHNYFSDIPVFSGGNGAEAIRIGTSDYSMKDSYTTVEYNLFENCDGEIEIISNKSCENIYRYNTFLHSAGCMTLRHGNRCQVYGNYFFGDLSKSSGGIRIIGEDHKVYNNYLQDLMKDEFRAAISITNGVPNSPLNRYYQVKNAKIVNNTVVNCKYPICVGAGADSELSLSPLDCTIANNVIVEYNSAIQRAIDYVSDPINMTYENNMIYVAIAKRGDYTGTGITYIDPLLSNETDFYRPTSSSPVIAAGVSSFDFLTHDIDGQSRASGNDVGCDQISNESIANKPLSSEDIGTEIGVIIN
jgi:poly(beta-D-mannuronate) lyase